MSELKLNYHSDLVSNIAIYGLEESLVRSGYPMQTATKEDINHVENKDVKRARVLANTPLGSGHANFLKGIIVQFDLNFSLKAWPEAQRYNWLDFISSCSTMHRVTKFDIKKCCNNYVWEQTVMKLQNKANVYNQMSKEEKSSEKGKELYLEILYNLPTGFKLKAGMTTNYLQLKTIYHQRKDHRLPEWREFCEVLEILPMSELITGKIKEEL